jgi:hypothetical protein
MARNLLSRTKFVKVKDHSAASTADVNSDIVDTAGYEGVVFFTSFGTANATNTIKVQQSATNATDDMTDLTGTSVASGTSDEDVIVEVHHPTDRYVRAVVARGASSTCESIWACLYGKGGNIAANSLSGTQIAEVHAGPSEGTA